MTEPPLAQPPLARPPTTIERVAFLGTPPAAVPSLQALVKTGYQVPIVVTQPDRRRGRGSTLVPSPVKEAALDLGLTVADRPDVVIEPGVDVDLAVVVAYGRLLRRSLLEEVAMINVHFSLLPRWRGAAPVERAILAGDETTGVTIMALTEGLDEGPIHSRAVVDIGPDETAAELTERLARVGADLLVATLDSGLSEPTPQAGVASYADRLDRGANELDFDEPAIELHRRARVGRAWTVFRHRRLGIESTRVAVGAPPLPPGSLQLVSNPIGSHGGDSTPAVVVGTGDGGLILDTVKPEGRRSTPALDWWNGIQPEAGERLGR